MGSSSIVAGTAQVFACTSARVEDRIGDCGGFDGGLDLMHPHDGGAAQDGGGNGGEGGVTASGGRKIDSAVQGTQGASEKRLARDAGEQRPPQHAKLAEAGEQRKVGLATFTETEAGIEHNASGIDTGGMRGIESVL
jgi:hypothetical protein